MPTKVTKAVVKKATPKKVVKKPAVKKLTQAKGKELMYANNKNSFWVKNGEVLNSLIALRNSLEEMDKEIFVYHANKGKNDFADWVEKVLFDEACAEDLRQAKSAGGAKIIVERHLKFYQI